MHSVCVPCGNLLVGVKTPGHYMNSVYTDTVHLLIVRLQNVSNGANCTKRREQLSFVSRNQ